MDRATVIDAFHRMGEILWRQKKTADIAVYGGSAIILQFDFRQSTDNVDALIGANNHGAVQQAQFDVADEMGLPRGWLNEQVARYLSRRGEVDLYGVYPSDLRPGLRVYTAQPSYILAMKVLALRVGTQDLTDAVSLACELDVTTVAQLENLVRQFYPDRQLTDIQRVAMLDLVRRIHASNKPA